MADSALTPARRPAFWGRVDKAWLLIAIVLLLLALLDPGELGPTLSFAGAAFGRTSVFIIFAVLAVGYLKATGAESLLARAFEGRETRMIVLAAMVGGLSPFCSCEVIPFIAAMLSVGAPLSAVMAFWLSSPLMDPAMFIVTSGSLGAGFALAKTAAAVGIGLFGGMVVRVFAGSALLADPLKQQAPQSCGCRCGAAPGSATPVWRFWQEPGRRTIFRETALENAFFLGKWLLLAYIFEALMLRYVPAGMIAGVLGGDGLRPILLAALVGAPAYLNGFAAVPLVEGLLRQGMSDGAAMSFMLAGGISSIPAAVAVWALVKPRIFATYLSLAMIGAVLAGLAWSLVV